MSKVDVDVAVIGAGPYGLSVAAELAGRGIEYRLFGSPMHTWREHMPDGMFLRSEGFASNFSDPRGEYGVNEFFAARNLDLRDYATPIPLDVYCDYGQWFIEQVGIPVEDTNVEGLVADGEGFLVELATGESLRATHVVLAVGVSHFAHIAEELQHLPRELCSHSADHSRLDGFDGKDVTVIGVGQSARETVALLNEHGATTRMVGRATGIRWNPYPMSLDRPLLKRLRRPISGFGPGWEGWMYEQAPEFFRWLPEDKRVFLAKTKYGPQGAWWLRERVEAVVPTLLGRRIADARDTGDKVELDFVGPMGPETITTEHVIAATGYRTDLQRLRFLDSGLRDQLRTAGGAPILSVALESSVPRLYVVGMAAAPSLGPAMRFVAGATFAGPTVARAIAHGSGRGFATWRQYARVG